MKYQIYSIRDAISEEFSDPFLAKNQKSAWRKFKITKSEHKKRFVDEDLIREIEENYELFYLGEFNTGTGEFGIAGEPKEIKGAFGAGSSDVIDVQRELRELKEASNEVCEEERSI